MFGIVLPQNFNSPYKAQNIAEFWRRWHMTLSRFLREYLYIPLGGNRQSGEFRRYLNLVLTMVLGGLWHGAAWTFVLWGGVHGLMLVLNHAWHYLRRRIGLPPGNDPASVRVAACALTFIAVTSAWVLFRASSLGSAGAILSAMYGLEGQHAMNGLVEYGQSQWRLLNSSDGPNPAPCGSCS